MNTSLDLLAKSADLPAETVLSAFDDSDEMIERVKVFFVNGYGVSIIRGRPGSILEEALPPEGAILRSDNGKLDDGKPLAEGVTRHEDANHVREFIREVANRPPLN